MECYFDHVATNPLSDEVLQAMMPYFREEFGNPLSIYPLGINAREAVEKARQQVAALINAKPSEIIFTSSGAEANNFALRGIALARQYEGKHVIVTRMEHHSILNSARFLEKLGFTVTYLTPDKQGYIDPDAIKKAITDETVLISVIHASPEVGTIEPVKEIAGIAKERNISFHSDGVVSVGHIPVDVKALGVDLLSFSAHQFYGPKGASALYIREGQRVIPLIFGGIQESGRRAGTENVPAIVGMGKAAEITMSELERKMAHVRGLRDRLVEGIMKIENVHHTGHPENRLPGHASFCVEFIEGEGMLLMLASLGIYVASGSACTSKALKASPVLLSMGIPSHVAHGSVVFSLGTENTVEQIDYTLEEFPRIIRRLRELSPFAQGWDAVEEGESCTPKK
ncbi:cysteine desulfurase [bacterium BMS3Bbin06]|nr:cysteine desulfurase [bacterium BMS3Abin08]GBE35598.1 cysteine desulfurase [bacterium BMS3Bbin06]HDO35362.1 cysteine desulfurase [Nitrospirota bacterium]HDY70760.1 cysteine desulfurase [Nitrospirota bacterium]